MLQADLRHPLELADASVDAVFSVATLHWVPDHAAVFAEIARVLRPGGRVALDYGGPGNVAEVGQALRELGRDYAEVDFPDAEQESAGLAAAGFAEFEVQVRREEPFVPGVHLSEYLRTICLGRQLAELDGPDGDRLVADVAARLPGGAINYVRTEVDRHALTGRVTALQPRGISSDTTGVQRCARIVAALRCLGDHLPHSPSRRSA